MLVDSVLVDASQLIGEGRGKDFCVCEYNAGGLIFVYQTSFFLDDFSWVLFLVFILNVYQTIDTSQLCTIRCSPQFKGEF